MQPQKEDASADRRMLSLDNAYSINELREFHKRVLKGIKNCSSKDIEYFVELKFDGLAVALTYEKGVFGAPTFVVNNKIFWGQDRLEYALAESLK